MDITIKHNDAYRALAVSTGIPETTLAKGILNSLEQLNFFMDWTQEIGKTLDEVLEISDDFKLKRLIKTIFPSKRNNPEVVAFFGGILFWGTGDCPECGGDLESEEDGVGRDSWMKTECTNPECTYCSSGEPDWEMSQGGRKWAV